MLKYSQTRYVARSWLVDVVFYVPLNSFAGTETLNLGLKSRPND